MKYTVITDSDAKRLIARVNALIAKGWRPQGGVTYDSYNFGFFQAMIREED